jgi:hypothetical protein
MVGTSATATPPSPRRSVGTTAAGRPVNTLESTTVLTPLFFFFFFLGESILVVVYSRARGLIVVRVRSLTLGVLSDAWTAVAVAQTSDACVPEPTQAR